jgi:hypothetical protein
MVVVVRRDSLSRKVHDLDIQLHGYAVHQPTGITLAAATGK